MNSIATANFQSVVTGVERAYDLAVAIEQLRELLTAEYLAPIMKLQGTRLGFRTDRDRNDDGSKGPGYPMEIVKECFIEAILLGVQPVGNHFNIIAGGCYITKEGYGYLLKHLPQLTWWKITEELPRINADATSAAVTVKIEYSQNGVVATPVSFPIPVKMNKRMGTDAVIGKARRKARKWLHEAVTGNETPDGDILDIDYETVKSTTKEPPIQHADLTALFQANKHFLTAEEIANGERIIALNEVNSYLKLKTLLNNKAAATMPGA